ncbi:mutator type transposase, partial [Tanacetum coccineum]
RTPKSLTLEIHHGGCFTPIPSRSYVGGQVSSVNVVDIDEFCLHDLKDMVVKLGYGVADLMYYHFLIPRLGLDYGMHPLNVDVDVLEMAKYVKDYKIILVYVEHGSSIFVTPKKGVSIAVDNYLRKGPIEIDSSPDVNRNLTPMCHRNLTKEWEQPASSVEVPIVVESADDPFENLDEILGDYANTGKQIIEDEITGKQMVVHVGNSSTVDDVLDMQILFETEGVGPIGKFKEVDVDADNESEEKGDTEGNDTSGSGSEDSDYGPKHDQVFDDDEHIVEDVHVSMNNFSFTADPKHDLSIGGVEIQENDLDVIDYDSFGSDLDDGIDSQKRIQLRKLRRICKKKNKGPNKYYFYLGQQFATKEIVTGRVMMHSVETRRKLIMADERAVQDQMQKQFDVGVSKMKAFRANRIATDKMTGSITVRIDVQQEPNPESLTRTFRRVYVCLGALKQGFRACGREILGLDGCFMSGPWPGQILTAVGVDANNGIYPVAYAIVEAESKASWCWFLNLLGEDLGIEANFNYTFISDRQKGLIQAIASVFPSAEHRYCVRHIHENIKSQFKGGVYKEMIWNAAKATFEGRAKCDLLINNIYEVFNRQLVDGRDQPIITCLEYIREYLMKKIVVVQKVIAKTVGPLTPSVTKTPYKDQYIVNMDRRVCSCKKLELTVIPCKHVVAAIYNMSENSVGVGIPEQWVHAAYRLETWAHVYLFKVNSCNGRNMWLVVESRTVIIPPLYKPPIGRPPKKRKKSNDKIASQIVSSSKLSRKGKSVSCDKCDNVGHNRKGCRGQGGGSSQAGARKVSGQAPGSRKVSGQAAGSRKVSGQAVGARNVSGQAAGARKASSQPSAA